MRLLLSKIKDMILRIYAPWKIKKNRIEFKNYLKCNTYNKMDYCIECNILILNTYFIYHCNLCNTCHYKNKLYCNICNKCYDPLIDKDLIMHRKICLNNNLILKNY